MSEQRYLFVWEDVWTDWTSGIAFAVADSLTSARKVMSEKFADTWGVDEINNNSPIIIPIEEDYANGVPGGA